MQRDGQDLLNQHLKRAGQAVALLGAGALGAGGMALASPPVQPEVDPDLEALMEASRQRLIAMLPDLVASGELSAEDAALIRQGERQ
jgi:hypothetical protein